MANEELSSKDQQLLADHRRAIRNSLLEVKVVDTLLIGLQRDGAHHKQYALWRVAELLGLTHYAGMRNVDDRGIAP